MWALVLFVGSVVLLGLLCVKFFVFPWMFFSEQFRCRTKSTGPGYECVYDAVFGCYVVMTAPL